MQLEDARAVRRNDRRDRTMTDERKIPVLRVTPAEAKRALLVLAGVVAWWCASWLAIGPSMEPRGPVFAVCVLLFVATFAGHYVARFPPCPRHSAARRRIRHAQRPGAERGQSARRWTRVLYPRCAPPRSGSSSCARVSP